MKKFRLIVLIIVLVVSLTIVLTSCNNDDINGFNNDNNGSQNTSTNESEIKDENTVEEIESNTSTHNFKLISSENGTYHFECEDAECTEENDVTITIKSGTNSVQVQDETITFSEITEDTECDIVGSFYGNIVIDAGDKYTFELSLQGFSLTSQKDVPIYIKSAGEAIISAKKETTNYIYDIRSEVDENGTSASIYSKVDLSIQGKGNLYVKSENNNGIHTKDNLSLKNLTLQVESEDNCLKGNDGVKIESGDITLIARTGDGIKTSNSHVSSKGKQKGDIKLQGGKILIYAATDGIDAAHDVIVNESESTLNLQVFTDKYSKYSEEVTATSDDILYIRYSSTAYKYSIEYSNDASTVWYNSSTYKTVSGMGMGGQSNLYYFPITKPSGYTKMRVFIYSSSQTQGQSNEYLAYSDYLTINDNYDTFALQNGNGGLSYGWTNYTTTQMGPGGGMQEGNSDKGDYSTKGIKADNEINIESGTITIKSYDDAIHTNSDVQLGEEGAYYYGTGDILISGGTITVYSNDDGIHADGSLEISGGSIKVTNSYEGLEGDTISISNGDVTIKSSDDGMNSCSTSGVGISISGGTIYVYAGGDGLDSNSKTSYQGFNISGGKTVIISTGNADSALDTENGYTYSGGYVVAVGRSGGMSSESTKCSNFSSVGTSKSLSVQTNNYLYVKDVAYIKMPTSISASVVVLGKTSASISSVSSIEGDEDSNGVNWIV